MTVTDFPFSGFMSVTRDPNGSVRCAAVRPQRIEACDDVLSRARALRLSGMRKKPIEAPTVSGGRDEPCRHKANAAKSSGSPAAHVDLSL